MTRKFPLVAVCPIPIFSPTYLWKQVNRKHTVKEKSIRNHHPQGYGGGMLLFMFVYIK